MPKIVIRAATGADSGAIAALHAASWRVAYRGIFPDDWLDGPADDERARFWATRMASLDAAREFVLLAEADAEPLAFICVVLDADPERGALVDNLHTRPDCRGQGLGKRLLDEAARRIETHAAGSPVHLFVFEGNEPAARFYERLGAKPAAHCTKRTAAGTICGSICYLWPDAGTLLRATAGARTPMIRAYLEEDFGAVHRTAARDYAPREIAAWAPNAPDLDAWKTRLATGTVLVAECDGLVAGFCRLDESGRVDLLYVDPAYQRQGVARALLVRVLSVAADRGCRVVTTEASRTARPFFEAMGFHLVRPQWVDRRGAQIDNFLMERGIPPRTASR